MVSVDGKSKTRRQNSSFWTSGSISSLWSFVFPVWVLLLLLWLLLSSFVVVASDEEGSFDEDEEDDDDDEGVVCMGVSVDDGFMIDYRRTG